MILTRDIAAASAASALHSPIRVEFIGGRFVRVLDSISWSGPFPASVPVDFVSDGGTIPAAAWPIVGHPLSASALVLYLLHDVELQAGVAWDDAKRRLDVRAKALGMDSVRRTAIVSAIGLKDWWDRLTGR